MSAFNLTPTIIEGGNFNAKMGVVNANSDNYNKLKNKPSINGVELVGDKTNEDIGAISAPKTAKVGQTIKVKSVDENNHPTEWESVDLPKPLPTPADGDSGKVPMVQDDLSYSLEKVNGSGIDLTGAAVGQIAKITAVDDNGKPTAWKAIDLPNGLPAVTTEDAGKVPVVQEDGSYGLANIKDVPVYLGTIPVSPDTALYLVAPVKDYKKVIIVKERASQSTGLTSYLYAGLYQPVTKKMLF